MMLTTRSTAKLVCLVSSIILLLEAFNVQGGTPFGSHGVGNYQMKLNKRMAGSVHKNFRSIKTLSFNGGATGLDNEDNNKENDEPTVEEEVQMDAENPEEESVVPISIENELDTTKENTGIGEVETEPTISSPSSKSDQPIRISTSRKFGMRRNVSKANENGKMTRKERRALKRQKKLEEKSHRQIAKKLKNRNSLNIKRKVLHAGFGFFFATLNQVIPKSIFVPGMTFITSLALFVELMRYRKGWGFLNDLMHLFLGGSLRKHEMEGKFTGSFYYFLGVTITAALFPTSCATLGIMQLAIADPSASFFGSQTKHVYWSRIENGFFGIGRNKGILGFLGGAAFCFPFNYYVLSIAKYGTAAAIPGGRASLAAASIALGLAGAFADLCVPTPALTMPKKIFGVPVPPFHVDDNVVVPILSGYACTKIFESLGWTSVDLAKWILF